jgi:integrase
MQPRVRPATGHVFMRDGKRGRRWYIKYRLPNGRQVQKEIGPAWTSRREKPPLGYLTRASAQTVLDETLVRARRGELGGVARMQAKFSDAADEWLRYVERDRERKASTIRDYRLMIGRLKRDLGQFRLEDVTPERIESYRDSLIDRGLSNRTVNKYLVVLHGIFKRAMKAYRLPSNPLTLVEKRPNNGKPNIDVFSREEVMALARKAASELDATLYMTAAFTGLRMGELFALRWRDVDFELDAVHVRRSFTGGREGTPKSGKERTVPMAAEVAAALARLSRRERFVADDDLVFSGKLGGHLSPSRVRIRYKAALRRAGLRLLRFHDLRHTFGTHAIRTADSREVMEWMGHQDLKTTQLYLAFKPQRGAARRISEAFQGADLRRAPAESAEGATASVASVD